MKTERKLEARGIMYIVTTVVRYRNILGATEKKLRQY